MIQFVSFNERCAVKNLPEIVSSYARFSADGLYRYSLFKSLHPVTDHDKTMLWIMLNPSTATHEKDDPTVRKCQIMSFSRGFYAVTIANLFALRSTDPKGIMEVDDPIGPENMDSLELMIKQHASIVVAWGSFRHPLSSKMIQHVRACSNRFRRRLNCLKVNKDGNPKHPLYVAYRSKLIEWS